MDLDEKIKRELEDPRLHFFENFVLKLSNTKKEKWTKMVTNGESRDKIFQFLKDPAVPILFFWNNGTLMLPQLGTLPEDGIGKGIFVYFMRKKNAEEITIENMRDSLLFGSCSNKPIKDLVSLTDGVYVPVLTNPLNQDRWPKVLEQDTNTKLQELRNSIAETMGNMNNRTILPMPLILSQMMSVASNILAGELDKCSIDMKESLEQVVLKWSKSIDQVLAEESYNILIVNKHATPADEIKFWKNRLENLLNIYDQLVIPEVKTIALILEKINSIYLHTFRRIFTNVNEAIHEARDISLYLQPLDFQLGKMEANDFTKVGPIIIPLVHTITLIWSKSKYCCTNKRMVHLFLLTHNFLIAEATRCLDPSTIFQGDPDDMLFKTVQIIEILGNYKQQQRQYQRELITFPTDNAYAQIWTFKPDTIFATLDAFVDRLNSLKMIFEITFEFKKLEDILFGGDKGARITMAVRKIRDRFVMLYTNLDVSGVDPLNMDDSTKFLQLFDRFTQSYQDLERSLAFQFNLAFDDCVTSLQYIKLMINLGTSLYRPIIYKELQSRFNNIVILLEHEIVEIKKIFDEYSEQIRNDRTRKNSILDSGYAALIGNIAWLHQLRRRITETSEYFSLIQIDVFDNEFGEHTKACIDITLDAIDNFQKEHIIDVWKDEFVTAISTSMENTLLLRGEKMQLIENFAIDFTSAFKGLNYLRSEKLATDDSTLLHFQSIETEMWELRLHLLRIVEWYNYLMFNTHETEKTLIQSEMDGINQMLEPTLTESNWSNYENSYILELKAKVRSLYERIRAIQANLESALSDLKSWNSYPLYVRKRDRASYLLNINNRAKIIHDRFSKCLHSKALIDFIMMDNLRLFENIPVVLEKPQYLEAETKPTESPGTANSSKVSLGTENRNVSIVDWKSMKFPSELTLARSKSKTYSIYENHVDALVGKEILTALETSLRYIRNELENKAELECPPPLIEIRFVLERPTTRFIPSLDTESQSGFTALFTSIIIDIYGMADMIPRVATIPRTDDADTETKLPTYETIIGENVTLEKLRLGIMKNVNEAAAATRQLFKKYQNYEAVWVVDRGKYLKEFLKYGRHLTLADIVQIDSDQFHEKPMAPTLDVFEREITDIKKLAKVIEELPAHEEPVHWLRVDLREFKSSMLFEIRQWGQLFINYLKNHVTSSLEELHNFIGEANEVLKQEIEEHEYEKLVQIISILRNIEDRTMETDSMFDPLKKEVELLKKFDEDLDSKINTHFLELPQQWNQTKKTALLMAQTIAPVQLHQVDLTRKRVTLLEIRVKSFRERFKQMHFYDAKCPNAYKLIDKAMKRILFLEHQAKNLDAPVLLFSIEPPDCSAIEKCRRESVLLKLLWDFAYSIQHSIDAWKLSPWKSIDIESMDAECKEFGRQLRMLDKDARSWDPYIKAEADLKNLMTSLRAVNELQNPALRERHWLELKRLTKIQLKMDSSMTLDDLLALNLYRYEDEVKNIVDKAVKEMAMEKQLKDIKAAWSVMKFDCETHARSGLSTLRMSEDLIEVLEDHQVQLQNMLSSKFVGFFFSTVNEWQSQLANVDQVVRSWFEVQRKWAYLESIFIGSEDIRIQLPEDTERFDRINDEFKAILQNIVSTAEVLAACAPAGLHETLERLLDELSHCERALNYYLESKRLAFPRFYFISSADLLDILANGNQPELVCKHLIKLYDSLAKLVFRKSTKLAMAMISKENEEVVDFISDCNCDGRVEFWLNNVSEIMKGTLHTIFLKALLAYEEKPRESWVGDWPAQPALCVTQICWSNETNAAFQRLEGGYENAIRDYSKKQVSQLNALINLLLGQLTKGERQKITTICTIDVHSRDVITKLISQKVRSVSAFQWQSQLRHRWDNTLNNCFVNICDAQFRYDFEYLGNTARLVITPLTDRCYITLTQSLHLVMGGAPAGPAGTGKTETTKDLGKGQFDFMFLI